MDFKIGDVVVVETHPAHLPIVGEISEKIGNPESNDVFFWMDVISDWIAPYHIRLAADEETVRYRLEQ